MSKRDFGSLQEIDLKHDAIDDYFECITLCSLDDEGIECTTRCLSIHLKNEDE